MTITNNASGSGQVNFSVNGINTSLGEGNSQLYNAQNRGPYFQIYYSQDGNDFNYSIPIGAIAQFYYDGNGTLVMSW